MFIGKVFQEHIKEAFFFLYDWFIFYVIDHCCASLDSYMVAVGEKDSSPFFLAISQ